MAEEQILEDAMTSDQTGLRGTLPAERFALE
jgi:hypothetical protein